MLSSGAQTFTLLNPAFHIAGNSKDNVIMNAVKSSPLSAVLLQTYIGCASCFAGSKLLSDESYAIIHAQLLFK